jgi:hypothetical protein
MAKTMLTADEYLCWITDLAENGSTEVDESGETERRAAQQLLFGLYNEPGLFQEILWWNNASDEAIATREAQEEFERYMR